MQAPKISYLVSTYDSARFLGPHLSNLLNGQTEKAIEVIVYNAASPGADLQIAEEWAERDERVRIIDSPERTPYGTAWLECWKIAQAPYVCNSNTDDFHVATFTERFYHHWEQLEDTNVAFMYSGWYVRDEQGRNIGVGIKPPFEADVFQRECQGGPQVSWLNNDHFRRSVDWPFMEERATQHTSAYDYWLWLYFMSLGYEGYAIPELLTIYTQRPESIENRKPRQNTYEALASISEFFPHQFKGKLSCHKEFADFKNLPDKEEWINATH